MIISSVELLNMFSEEIQDEFDIPKTEIILLCKSLCKFIRREIEGDKLPEIGLKHFGTFSVRENRATFVKAHAAKNLKLGLISEYRYNKIIQRIANFESRKTK